MILDLLERERQNWTKLDPALETMLLALTNLVAAGGKRLRPAFVVLGFLAAGGSETDDRAVRVGAAVELLHAFALVHDDVIDGSSARRGQPSVHEQFAEVHRRNSWVGEDRRFGEGMAILVGDLAFSYADRLISEMPPAVIEVWNEMRIELVMGQYLDVSGSATKNRDQALATRIATYKSGKYTVERPLHLGAALAGRTDLFPSLSAVGIPLGVAFQLRDDVFGAMGSLDAVGKPTGQDLKEAKPTMLLALANEMVNDEQRLVLDRVGTPDLGKNEIVEIQRVLRESGALTELESVIKGLLSDTRSALEKAPLGEQARKQLFELADYVVERLS